MKHLEDFVRIANDLTAHELDMLISALAEVRANKAPPVSENRPRADDESVMDTPVTVEDSPAMQAKVLRDGRIRLWARSSGFGWLAFNLNLRDARTLRDWMSANVKGVSDLLGEQNPQRH